MHMLNIHWEVNMWNNKMEQNVIKRHIIMKCFSMPLVIRVMWFKALGIYDHVPTEVTKMPRIGENIEQLKLITAGERANSICGYISMRIHEQMAIPLFNREPWRKSSN